MFNANKNRILKQAKAKTPMKAFAYFPLSFHEFLWNIIAMKFMYVVYSKDLTDGLDITKAPTDLESLNHHMACHN